MAARVKVVAIVTFPGEHAAHVEAALREAVAASRCEPGCEEYALHREMEREHTLILLETWKDQDAVDAHSHAPSFQRLMRQLDGRANLSVIFASEM